jgi:hypothetical protein
MKLHEEEKERNVVEYEEDEHAALEQVLIGLLKKDQSELALRCVVCDNEDAATNFILTCGHAWCYSCLIHWMKGAIHDEEQYPVECCYEWGVDAERAKEIPALKDVVEEYEHKAIEWGTSNRTYCANPHCARFLGGEEGTDLHCNICNISTCVQCKSGLHTGQACPKDPETERILQMAEFEKWRRCPKCLNVVIKAEGCDALV